jgi:hypothetical protein
MRFAVKLLMTIISFAVQELNEAGADNVRLVHAHDMACIEKDIDLRSTSDAMTIDFITIASLGHVGERPVLT